MGTTELPLGRRRPTIRDACYDSDLPNEARRVIVAGMKGWWQRGGWAGIWVRI